MIFILQWNVKKKMDAYKLNPYFQNGALWGCFGHNSVIYGVHVSLCISPHIYAEVWIHCRWDEVISCTRVCKTIVFWPMRIIHKGTPNRLKSRVWCLQVYCVQHPVLVTINRQTEKDSLQLSAQQEIQEQRLKQPVGLQSGFENKSAPVDEF